MQLREGIRLSLIPLCIAGLANPVVAQAPTEQDEAQRPRIVAEVGTTSEITLSPEEESALSLAAGRILIHVDRAREAVADQDQERTLAELGQARTLVDIVKEGMPTYTVSTKITAGDLSYAGEDQVQPLAVDVFAELHQVAVLAPVTAAKREAGEVGRAAGLPVMTEAGLRHTRTILDVALAEAGAIAAERAVQEGNWDLADRALRNVQAGVVYHAVEVDLPLVRARTNLVIARDALDAGFVEEAKAALQITSDALERYEQDAGEHRAEQAKSLREQINQFAQELTEETGGAQEQLTAWWQEISSWFE